MGVFLSKDQFFMSSGQHSPFIRHDSCLIRIVRQNISGPDIVVQQLKGGDPMSSEKPGTVIGSVCVKGFMEQPLGAL